MNSKLIIVALLCSIISPYSARITNFPKNDKGEPTVTIGQGLLRGKEETTKNGFKYNTFYNIPYAKPPVGNLRFQNPKEPDEWIDTRDATRPGPVCVQYDNVFNDKKTYGVEDCLVLNVFTPSSAEPGSLATIVWIHGGGFLAGSGDSVFYGPQFLVEKNVVLVTINYRLGALGFMTLDIPEAPGNVGLKDQVMALKWVSKNIEKFGGDPDKVTIFGESAGAASVQYHLLSPMSRNLFKNAIAHSGSCIHEWAFDEQPLLTTHALADALGKPPSTDANDLLSFFRSLPAEEIVEQIPLNYQPFPFKPVREKSFRNQDAFLLDRPLDILRSGDFKHCPLISGFNSDEGIFASFIFKRRNGISRLPLPSKINMIPKVVMDNMTGEEIAATVALLEEFYPESPGGDNTNMFIEYMMDSDLLAGTKETLELISAYSPNVYSYNFTYQGDRNIMEKMGNLRYDGATHFDDIGYFFDGTYLKEPPTEADSRIIHTLTQMWTDFAKYDNPTPKKSSPDSVQWLPVSRDNFYSLQISDVLELRNNPFEKPVLFWDKIKYST